MRVPLSWLGEFVDLEPGTTPEEVHAALVSVGLEEEDIHTFELSGPIVVGQVLEFVEEPQSNGKTIRWCQVRVAPDGEKAADGGADVRGIVCGARNFFEGDKVVVTLPGAVLPGPFPIAARKTYGHVSDGMIASARELGLGEDHDGILRLSTLGLDPEVGTDAVSLLGLDDAAVEVNVTPDRGYAFSIRGIAREYSHATGAAFRDPADAVPLGSVADHPSGFSVTVDDTAPIRGRVGASVFVTRVVRDVDGSRPTPPWMIARLTLAGIRSISLIVDITNYVMLELGQPIHGYDLDKLSGGIVVRRATPGETLVTLDGQTRKLDPEDLVIADASGAIGLAGVMGGASTEIGDGTRTVLVEAANFDPVSIARTARRHKLPSEASKRFERGVDPQVAVAAAARVVQLLEQLAGGRADELGSLLDDSEAAEPIRLPKGYIASLVGVDFSDDEVRGALAEIGGTVTETADGLLVAPPTWRPDLRDKSDLAEEVARIVGYDRIPSVLPVAPPGRGLTREQRLRRAVAQTLADNGATEVLSFPFVSEAQNDLFGSAEPGGVLAVRLANALDATAPYLRTSLLPGLVDAAKRNLARGLVDLRVYELGTVFRPSEGSIGSETLPPGAALPGADILAGLNAGIPAQPRHLAGLVVGNAVEKQPGLAAVPAGLVDALDMVRQTAAAVGVTVDLVQSSHQALHPGRTARLVARGADGSETPVGYAGELLPALADDLDLPRIVAVFELDLDALIAVAPADIVAGVIAGFPAATQDLSLVVREDAPAGEVLRALREGAGELLEDIRLVDDYRGPGLPDAHKSLTFALRFRAADRTLTAAEASEAKLAGAARAGELFGAAIRE
ncbi:phenylalanine--tRNA ligase subunit beta [Leifsonia sp. 21MFCrub1.1]|uniref:phenylalanine--tRNA ligase subunit beta n=1 Tax=Leifsonia sp. 21MFCrub1.1 TaxID=1798223 RepID=UPI0008929C2F|nr:phenylalanine--tRNA ligase subunit beta [Leifsonia sp. 21MFCrub1.1]SEA98704.1 phenylalanyl-tRNA synthetase beta subunit [Leifsonia sp. 21MFCrub1.1]